MILYFISFLAEISCIEPLKENLFFFWRKANSFEIAALRNAEICISERKKQKKFFRIVCILKLFKKSFCIISLKYFHNIYYIAHVSLWTNNILNIWNMSCFILQLTTVRNLKISSSRSNLLFFTRITFPPPVLFASFIICLHAWWKLSL